jgi:hypothetical protein
MRFRLAMLLAPPVNLDVYAASQARSKVVQLLTKADGDLCFVFRQCFCSESVSLLVGSSIQAQLGDTDCPLSRAFAAEPRDCRSNCCAPLQLTRQPPPAADE